jgi:hypothetical protein
VAEGRAEEGDDGEEDAQLERQHTVKSSTEFTSRAKIDFEAHRRRYG